MADIKFVREYQFTPNGETWYDVLYAKSNRLCVFPAEDLPKTVKAWLKDKPKVVQYNRTLGREEAIYKTETLYRVEYDFCVGDKDVHAYLDNNGEGFCKEDAVYIGKQLATQGNMHVKVIAI